MWVQSYGLSCEYAQDKDDTGDGRQLSDPSLPGKMPLKAARVCVC